MPNSIPSTLKIDKTFIDGLGGGNTDDAVIARTIISLGHNLGLAVMAEGVETPEQAEILLRENCQYAQGFLFSEPVAGSEILPFTRRPRGI